MMLKMRNGLNIKMNLRAKDRLKILPIFFYENWITFSCDMRWRIRSALSTMKKSNLRRAVFLFSFVFFFCCICKVEGDTANSNSTQQNLKIQRVRQFFDTLRTDSLAHLLLRPYSLKVNTKILPKIRDPFDPFLNKAYFRFGFGKFWFFLITVVIVLVIIYYKRYFSKQFQLRLISLTNRYSFRELLMEKGQSMFSGSAVAIAISVLTMSLLIVLLLTFAQFNTLANNVGFFILTMLMWFAWRFVVYLIQYFNAISLDLGDLVYHSLQRQVSIDLCISLLYLPIINIAYFNSHRIAPQTVVGLAIGMGALWILLRISYMGIGMLRDGYRNFVHFLYFCAFEILPYSVLGIFLWKQTK